LRKFLSIEVRALRQSGPVEQLRFLRQVSRRRAARTKLMEQAMRLAVAVAVLLCGNQLGRSKGIALVAPSRLNRVTLPPVNSIWMVEETSARTLYSNGLTVRREYETESVPRRYHVYRRDTLQQSEAALTVPAGIVFHTTESEILPLEAARNSALLRSREDVLNHVRSGRCYNFVIDRFGQVSRIVPETQTALHAGHSVWASADSVWIDLNESFVGVSFEAESAGQFEPSAAQVHSGRLLTEMLRARYGIPPSNCVTHAQVSVNPDNMRVGYHTDWGSAFPFEAMGLMEGYSLPLASVALFGFGHDDTFLGAIGNRPWPGLVAAEQQVRSRSAQEGITADELKARLQQQYKTLRRQRHG